MLSPVASTPASGRIRLILEFVRVAFRDAFLYITSSPRTGYQRDLRMPTGVTKMTNSHFGRWLGTRDKQTGAGGAAGCGYANGQVRGLPESRPCVPWQLPIRP